MAKKTPKADPLESVARAIIRELDCDPKRIGFKGTPERFAKAMRAIICPTYDPHVDLKTFHGTPGNVVQTNIPIYSFCEHHLLPFFGVAHVGLYFPVMEVLGLSKIARIAQGVAKRLTIQETLTARMAMAFVSLHIPLSIVQLECRHLCQECRGVGTKTVTTTRYFYRQVAHSAFGEARRREADALEKLFDQTIARTAVRDG